MKTPEEKIELGKIVGHQIAFPHAETFDDLFSLTAPEPGDKVIGELVLSPYCQRRTRQNGYQALSVRAHGPVENWLVENTIGGRMVFQLIDRGDNETLVTAVYDQIIGSRWLGFIRTDSIPEEARIKSPVNGM
jgi:hypothetical protein